MPAGKPSNGAAGKFADHAKELIALGKKLKAAEKENERLRHLILLAHGSLHEMDSRAGAFLRQAL